MRRLETLEERDERKAAYTEAKCIEHEKRGEFWVITVHPMVEFRTQATGLNKSIKDAASPNCLLGTSSYQRIVKESSRFHFMH